jgi:hypothetical protein
MFSTCLNNTTYFSTTNTITNTTVRYKYSTSLNNTTLNTTVRYVANIHMYPNILSYNNNKYN